MKDKQAFFKAMIKLFIAYAIFTGLIAAVFVFFYFIPQQMSKQKIKPTPTISTNPTPKEKTTFCTQDAKQCPDGTWVGRSGPKCEFVCPK